MYSNSHHKDHATQSTNPLELVPVINQLASLYYNYKHYHWNLQDEDFIQFHNLFDSHALQMLEAQDELAERLRQLDILIPSVTVSASTDLVLAKGNLQAVLTHLNIAHLELIDNIKDKLNQDSVTTDLLTEILSKQEKMRWFIHSSMV